MKNLNGWVIYDGMSEGSGRSEKHWLINQFENEIGLFKFPKSNETKECISERLAYQIGNIIGIDCAVVDVCEYNNRQGCLSYKINAADEDLIEGIQFISNKYPNYDLESMYDSSIKEYYSLEMILSSVDEYNIKKEIFRMIIFDFLIGNTDRHQNNWAIIQIGNNNRMSPLYDNGSSLCCYVKEETIESYLGKDIVKLNSLVDTKSRSRIRINKLDKKEPTHKEMLEYLRDNYYEFVIELVENIKETLKTECITDLINSYPNELLSNNRKNLIIKFIIEKIKILKELF